MLGTETLHPLFAGFLAELAADFLHLEDTLPATAGINQNSQSQREI